MLSADYLSPDEIEAVAAEFGGQRIAIPEPGAFLLGMVRNDGFATVQGHVYDLHKPSGTLVRRDVIAFIERYRAFTVRQRNKRLALLGGR